MRIPLAAAVAVALSVAVAVPAGAAHAATYPIEARYQAKGPEVMASQSVTDSAGAITMKIYYPANIGGPLGLTKRPVVTWGNGTNSTPDDALPVIGQLVSWGFVVAGSMDPTTADGTSMLAALDYVLARNSDPTSLFYGHLDPEHVGVVGHSQGAGGTVNAANHSNGLIDTAVPICLPDMKWVDPGDGFSVADLRVPTLFLGGSADKFISPPATEVGYYTAAGGPAALGVLKSASHNTIGRAGNGFLGYLTAWMMWQLQGDQYAKGAFVGLTGPPELNVNANWQNQAEKGLS